MGERNLLHLYTAWKYWKIDWHPPTQTNRQTRQAPKTINTISGFFTYQIMIVCLVWFDLSEFKCLHENLLFIDVIKKHLFCFIPQKYLNLMIITWWNSNKRKINFEKKYSKLIKIHQKKIFSRLFSCSLLIRSFEIHERIWSLVHKKKFIHHCF